MNFKTLTQGYFCVPNSTIEDKTMKPFPKLVLLYLYRRGNSDGVSWPSLDLIAEELLMSKRSVQNCIEILKDKGFIKTEKRISGGRQVSNYYELSIPMETTLRVAPPASRGSTSCHRSTTQRSTKDLKTLPPCPISEDLSIGHSPKGTRKRKDYPAWFNDLWAIYRGVDKTATYKQLLKRVREGAAPKDLIASAKNYSKGKRFREGFKMNGRTFYGPSGHWEDFIDGLPEGDQSHADRVTAALEGLED